MIKNKRIILLLFFMLLKPLMTKAQFYTIDDDMVDKSVENNTVERDNEKNIVPLLEDSVFNKAQKETKQKLFALPLQKIEITSGFGSRFHPVLKKYRFHNGIDLRARYEDVFSMLPGKVVRVGENAVSGKYILVKTGDFTISYCHLSKIILRIGRLVSAGDRLGVSGNSGRTTGPHLHLTIKNKEKFVNPMELIRIFNIMFADFY